MSHQINYRVAQAPKTSTIEEAEESPVNYVQRPHGTGEKATSFIASDKLKNYGKLDRTCMPGLRYYEPVRDATIPPEVGMGPNSAANDGHEPAYIPGAQFQFDDGIRAYDPELRGMEFEAMNWVADNVTHGALPSGMMSREEIERNIAENSFDENILSVSRNAPPLFPATLNTSVRRGSLGGSATRRGSGNNRSLHNSTLNSSLNSSTDSTRRTSWDKNKDDIARRLMFGGDEDPTLTNRTFPVPGKNLKGLYTPMEQMDFAVNHTANTNIPQTSEGRVSLGQEFGNVSVIPAPSPYQHIIMDPRTSTPKKAGAPRIAKPASASFLTQNSYTHNNSTINGSSFFGNMFDSVTSAQLNDAMVGTSMELSGSSQPATTLPTASSSPPDISAAELPVPSNSAHSSPEALKSYELDSDELLTKLSKSLPDVENGTSSDATKSVNKSLPSRRQSTGSTPRRQSFTPRPQSFTPRPQSFTPGPSRTITMTDTGNGVSVHTKKCTCSPADKARNNCVCLHEEGAILRIITKPNIISPPCCKDAQGKLNHIAAINAHKVMSLTNVIKQKQEEFKIMLAENLKLAKNNFQLKEMLKAANVKFHRQQNATNELITKHQALQTQLDIAQHKVSELEQKGGSTESATEKIVSRLSEAYDKIMAHSEKQQEEIEELTNVLEQVDEENRELVEQLREAGIMVTSHMSERSQNDSVFSSMSEENSILSQHCEGYQSHVATLENSIRHLDARVQNLSAMNEELSLRNRSLSGELSMVSVGTAAQSDPLNSSIVSEHNQSINGGLQSIVNFYKDVSENLQTQVKQRDELISRLEKGVVHESPASDDLPGPSNAGDDSFVSVSSGRESLGQTHGNQELKELGKKIASARSEIKGMKHLFHEAKTMMKDLADNPGKSSDPVVMGTFDNIYKQFKKVDKKNVSFEN